MVTPTARREAVGWLQTRGTSLRRACRVVGLSTASWRYQPRPNATNATVLARLQALAAVRARFGYRRLHILLGRDGLVLNHKRVHRLYRTAGLQVRRRRRKCLTVGERVPLPVPTARLMRWSMDFTVATLADGRGFRTLNIVDDFPRMRRHRSRSIAAGPARDGYARIRFPQEADDLSFGEPVFHRPRLSPKPDSRPKRYSKRGKTSRLVRNRA